MIKPYNSLRCPQCGLLVPEQDTNPEKDLFLCKKCTSSFSCKFVKSIYEDIPLPPRLSPARSHGNTRAFSIRGNIFLALLPLIFGPMFILSGYANSIDHPDLFAENMINVSSGILFILLGVFLLIKRTIVEWGSGKIFITTVSGPFKKSKSFQYDQSALISRVSTDVTIMNTAMTKIVIEMDGKSFSFGACYNESIVDFLYKHILRDKSEMID